MRNLMATCATVALVAAGCGAVHTASTLPVPSPPTEALKPWVNFPANANPRPLIVFEDSVEHIRAAGFPNNERKIAWLCNKIVLANGLMPSSGAAPGEISAATAYRELMVSRAANAGSMAECASAVPFVITAIRHSKAGFMTDRGTQQLAAWLFDVPEVDAYIGHLAVDPSSLWGGRLAIEGRGAQVSADGQTLRIGVTNPGTGPCDSGRYSASVAASSTAVAIAVLRTPNPSPQAPTACDLALRVGYISVTLAAPLGGRVLVDEEGKAGAACPENGPC